MFLLHEPSPDRVRRFLGAQAAEPLTYRQHGGSRGEEPPPGFLGNHARVRIGEGEAAYRRGIDALRRWAMYDMDWVRILPAEPPIEPGRTVGLLIRHYGFWSLIACRIVYIIEEDSGPVRRFGFGYGTLPNHAQQGEERFTIEWREADDSVWYELFSFSRPGALLTWIGFPLARWLQKRFARESAQAMIRAAR